MLININPFINVKHIFDIERTYNKNVYKLNNIQAIEIVKGRYDISYDKCNKDLHTRIEEISNYFIKPSNRY